MKKFFITSGLFVVLSFLSLGSLYAAQFSLVVQSNDHLAIYTAAGQLADIPPATVGKSITSPQGNFQVSYGKDVNDQWTVILSSSGASSSLSFSTTGHTIYVDGQSFVTISYKNQNEISIDPGYLGQVKLDDKVLTAPVVAIAPSALPKKSEEKKQEKIVEVKPVPAPEKKEVKEVAKQTSEKPAPAPAPTVAQKEPAPAKKTPEVMPVQNETASSGDSSNAKIPDDGVVPLTPALSEYLALHKPVFWSEPVTPPAPLKLPTVGVNEMKLIEVHGNVTVSPSADSKDSQPAHDGMVIPSGSVIHTDSNSTAAVLIGGIDSVRFPAGSTGQVDHNFDNGKRTTTVSLTSGTVFAKVGKRKDETQDFKVKTPLGIAAARGTDFAVTLHDGNMIVFTAAGTVELFDKKGKMISSNIVTTLNTVLEQSTATMTPDQKAKALIEILQIVDTVNYKLNALKVRLNAGETLTPEEQNYLNSLDQIIMGDISISNENGGDGKGKYFSHLPIDDPNDSGPGQPGPFRDREPHLTTPF